MFVVIPRNTGLSAVVVLNGDRAAAETIGDERFGSDAYDVRSAEMLGGSGDIATIADELAAAHPEWGDVKLRVALRDRTNCTVTVSGDAIAAARLRAKAAKAPV